MMSRNNNWRSANISAIPIPQSAGSSGESTENGPQVLDDASTEGEIFEQSESSDDEGEESALDPQFLAERKKSKQRKTEKKKNEKKYTKKVLDVASAYQLPHSSSAESRSVVEFVKYMMGCSARKFELPTAPSATEITIWKDWVDNREERIHKHLESYLDRKNPRTLAEKNYLINQELTRIKRAALDAQYCPAEVVRNPKISAAVKNSCDHEFQSKGFSRITFEWDKPNLSDSDWNFATANILASNWTQWSTSQQSLFKNTNFNVIKVIERWLLTAKKGMKKKESQNNRVDTMDESTSSAENIARHKLARKKIAEYRFKTAVTVFAAHPRIWSCFQDHDTVSDYEDSQDFRLPPRRILPAWRSAVFADLAHELDIATIQLTSHKSKSVISARLARNSSRAASEDEAAAERVPLALPFDAYDEDFLNQLSALEIQQMGIRDCGIDYTLETALEDLRKKTKPLNTVMAE